MWNMMETLEFLKENHDIHHLSLKPTDIVQTVNEEWKLTNLCNNDDFQNIIHIKPSIYVKIKNIS